MIEISHESPNCDLELLNKVGLNSQKIKATRPTWKRSQYRAAINWLSVGNIQEAVAYHIEAAGDTEMLQTLQAELNQRQIDCVLPDRDLILGRRERLNALRENATKE